MRIASVKSVALDCGFQGQALQTTRVASAMSRFPRFADRRASWMWPTKKVFVQVTSDDGHTGWGCTNGGEVVELIVNAHLARLIVGEDATDIDTLWEQMTASLLHSDTSGFARMAVAGVDIALWDLAAQAQGKPLADLLGAPADARLPVYATTSRPEALAGKSFHGLKAAAPYGPEAGADGLTANIDLLRRFAEAAGPDQPIMIDAFMAWDVDYTLRFAEAAEGLPLRWIEDPIPTTDTDGLIRLRAGMDPGIELALGNFAYSAQDCADLIRLGVADLLQPDVAWAGGVTEVLRIQTLARDADVPLILHNTCEQPWALALAAADPTTTLVEFVDRGDSSPLYHLSGPPPDLADGHVAVPRRAGGNRPPAHITAAFEDPTAPLSATGST